MFMVAKADRLVEYLNSNIPETYVVELGEQILREALASKFKFWHAIIA
jgi:hypothetical protein